MSSIYPKPPIGAIGLFLEWERILTAARELRTRAVSFGLLEEVAGIICPAVKRKRGRQKGSHSRILRERRNVLWRAYWEEKARSPGATDKEVADLLWARSGRKFGNSCDAIVGHIAKMKSDRNRPTLLEMAERPRTRGRPKKTVNTI
jgi:hypothetical protein